MLPYSSIIGSKRQTSISISHHSASEPDRDRVRVGLYYPQVLPRRAWQRKKSPRRQSQLHNEIVMMHDPDSHRCKIVHESLGDLHRSAPLDARINKKKKTIPLTITSRMDPSVVRVDTYLPTKGRHAPVQPYLLSFFSRGSVINR